MSGQNGLARGTAMALFAMGVGVLVGLVTAILGVRPNPAAALADGD
jgi:hypothetical protein